MKTPDSPTIFRHHLVWHDRLVYALIMLSLGFMLVGCGQQGPPRVGVFGTVTLDGEPVPKGAIHFVSIDQPGELVAATIEEGQFELSRNNGPLAGTARVNVQLYRDLGFELDDDGAYAAASTSSRKPVSPFEAAFEFRSPTTREVTLESDEVDLEIDLVSVNRRSRR